jgi:hypothetical protein
MVLSVKILFTAEYVLLELPFLVMSMIARWASIEFTHLMRLYDIISYWFYVGMAGHAVACITISCIYVFYAWSKLRLVVQHARNMLIK